MVIAMLLFLLIVVFCMFIIFAILACTVGGALGVFLFGYDILCIIFIVWIVKRIRRRKNR